MADVHIKALVDETLITELQVLARVVVSGERDPTSGRPLLEYISARQADYLTRKILINQVAGWTAQSRARDKAHERLFELKRLVDGERGDDSTSTIFADKVVRSVEWASGVREAIGPGERSAD